jgi:cytochrome P450
MKDWGPGIVRPWKSDPEPIDPALDADAILERILDPDRRGSLHPFYHRLRALAPCHPSRSPRLPRGCHVLTSYRHVDRVARSAAAVNDPDTARVFDHDGQQGAFYQLMRHAMLFLEKADHDRVRRLVYKAFTPRAIAPLRALTEQTANALLDAVATAGRMDFVRDFAYPLPIRVIGRLLGLPDEAQARIEEWAWDFARAGDPMTADAETIRRGNLAAEGFYGFFESLLDERRRRPQEDLMTTLVQAEDHGRSARQRDRESLRPSPRARSSARAARPDADGRRGAAAFRAAGAAVDASGARADRARGGQRPVEGQPRGPRLRRRQP